MKVKEFFKNKGWKKWDKSQWMIMILTGVLLMILAIPVDGEKKEEKLDEEGTEEFVEDTKSRENYVTDLEKRLEAALSQIQGAGAVKVMVTLEDFGESVVEKDVSGENTDLEESDEAGGIRREKTIQSGETTVYQEEAGEKAPFVGKEVTPGIAGILVVTEGGDNTAVKQNISDAVMALFQIDVNRIKVVKMNIQEEEY